MYVKQRDIDAGFYQWYYRKLSLKVKAEVTKMSMQYVSWLWQSLASHYCLPSCEAILDSSCAVVVYNRE